jgi:hypothetical protein
VEFAERKVDSHAHLLLLFLSDHSAEEIHNVSLATLHEEFAAIVDSKVLLDRIKPMVGVFCGLPRRTSFYPK